MAPAFSPRRTDAWRDIGERLEWLLPPDQLREAEQATPNAFYTPPGLAAACWQILRGLGFTRGRILEPGCGAGAFIAATPGDVEAAWVGVERDPVTARIAHLLHPSAQIINQPLQNAALPAHSMDAVIGNVPFGDVPVYDPTAPSSRRCAGATPASGYPDPGADSAIGLPCAGANVRNGPKPVQNPSW